MTSRIRHITAAESSSLTISATTLSENQVEGHTANDNFGDKSGTTGKLKYTYPDLEIRNFLVRFLRRRKGCEPSVPGTHFDTGVWRFMSQERYDAFLVTLVCTQSQHDHDY